MTHNPRLPEDNRLLFIEVDGAPHIVTCEGSLVPLDAVKRHFGKPLDEVRGSELKVPRGFISGKLVNLPDINDERFLDRDLIGRDDREFVTLFNIRRDVYSGRDLDRREKPDENIMNKANLIIEEAVAKDLAPIIPVAPNEQPMAIFPGGIAGSGKSLVVKTAKERFGEGEYLLIERDNMRPQRSFLYNVATHKDVGEHETDYRYIHDLFTEYHKIAVEGATRERLNIIKDGSLNDESNLRLFETLHNAGYYTQARFVMVPVEVALERNRKRFEEEGRIMPPDLLIKTGVNVFANMSKFMASRDVDSVVVIDNSVPIEVKKPVLAEVKYMDKNKLWDLRYEEDSNRRDTKFLKIDQRESDGRVKVLIVYDAAKLLQFFNDIGGRSPMDDEHSFSKYPLAAILSVMMDKSDGQRNR